MVLISFSAQLTAILISIQDLSEIAGFTSKTLLWKKMKRSNSSIGDTMTESQVLLMNRFLFTTDLYTKKKKIKWSCI